MFKIDFGLQILRPTQNMLFQVLLFLLFVASICPQKNMRSKQEVEAMIYTIKSHYLNLMGKHSDWLKRILEVVKLELTYRQVVWKCGNDSCLYSIQSFLPSEPYRNRRSIKRGRHHTKFKPNFPTTAKHKKTKIKVKEKPSKLPPDDSLLNTKSTEIHMSECKGRYVHYCKNGAKCVYIDLLQEAVCMCRKGFTGKRCVDFSLSDTVQSLRDYEMKTVNISLLNKKEYEAILSVMDATARFTYDANLKQPEEVKNILDMPKMNSLT